MEISVKTFSLVNRADRDLRSGRRFNTCSPSAQVGQKGVIEEERVWGSSSTARGAEMRSKMETHSDEAEKRVRDIRRATRRQFSAEEKVRIVIAGLRGEDSVAELCRKEGINQNLYYRWSKDFLEAGKKRLAGDTARDATSDEVKGLRAETHQLKELLAELMMENRVLKKRARGSGVPIHEVRGRREVGDHPAGRAVVIVSTAHPDPARDPAVHLLLLVRALSRPRRGRPRGSHAGAEFVDYYNLRRYHE